MIVKKDKAKKALDITGDAAAVGALIVDTSVTGGFIAGGKLLWSAVTSGVARRQSKQAEEFLERVATALGEEATHHLARDLRDDESNPKWDVIEEGFRAMMRSVHEVAKQAICALIADYVKLQVLPDREYQLAGELLAHADEHLLKVFLAITDELAEVSAIQSAQYPDAVVRGYNLVRGPGIGQREDIWMCCHITVDGSKLTLSSSGSPLSEKLHVALRLLDRFEFGALANSKARFASGYSSERHPNVHRVLFHTGPVVENRLRRLRNYLRYALA